MFNRYLRKREAGFRACQFKHSSLETWQKQAASSHPFNTAGGQQIYEAESGGIPLGSKKEKKRATASAVDLRGQTHFSGPRIMPGRRHYIGMRA